MRTVSRLAAIGPRVLYKTEHSIYSLRRTRGERVCPGLDRLSRVRCVAVAVTASATVATATVTVASAEDERRARRLAIAAAAERRAAAFVSPAAATVTVASSPTVTTTSSATATVASPATVVTDGTTVVCEVPAPGFVDLSGTSTVRDRWLRRRRRRPNPVTSVEVFSVTPASASPRTEVKKPLPLVRRGVGVDVVQIESRVLDFRSR